ncbi:hypothetical protein Tco_0388837, partial [Tanacetum coccineum]
MVFASNKPLYPLHMDLCGPMRVENEASEVIISFIKKTQVSLQLQVRRLEEKGDIGVFVGYSRESVAFRVYNKRTRKIHESVKMNFDGISEMASKQFKRFERFIFYDEYFGNSKITKSPTTNVATSNEEISLSEEEVFHEISESFQEDSSSSSLNDDVRQISRIEAIHVFLALTASEDFMGFQMDVKTAFLNEFLNRKCILVNLQ